MPFPLYPSQRYINSSNNVHLLNRRSYILPYCPPACSDSAMSSRRSLSLSVVTIFAIISPLLNGAILEKRPYILFEDFPYSVHQDLPPPQQVSGGPTAVAPVAAATQDTPPTPASLAIPMTSFALPEITAPPPSGPAGCTPLPQCRLYYKVSSTPIETYTASLIGHSS